MQKSEQEQPITSSDFFAHVPHWTPDTITQTQDAARNDSFADKVDLGIDLLCDEQGQRHIFKIVEKAQREIISESPDHVFNRLIYQEYVLMSHDAFANASQKLLFGDSEVAKQNQILNIHTITGTGALRLGFEFLHSVSPNTTVYIPESSWMNYSQIMGKIGIKVLRYPSHNCKTKSFDLKSMIECLEGAQDGSIVLLQACSHNPTGIDPSESDWKKIAEVFKKKELLPFFDATYLGFASGDLQKDAWPILHFANEGIKMIVLQSFTRNMGLYGERPAVLHFVCSGQEEKDRVLSQIGPMVRASYLTASIHGARIAYRILNNKEHLQEWKKEFLQTIQRNNQMRKTLRHKLEELKAPGKIYNNLGTWSHLTDQVGMFSCLGLTEKQHNILAKKHHVYLLNDRISFTRVNNKNVEYIAKSIKATLEEAPIDV